MTKFDISQIQFSRGDIKRGITLPEKMSSQLAEEMGVHLGDGSMNIYDYVNKHGIRRKLYPIQFTGSLEEKVYYKHLSNLVKNLYGFSGLLIYPLEDKTIKLEIYSKAIVYFKANVLNLPLGKKTDFASIPLILFNLKKFLPDFMRGLGDTDFSFTFKKKHKDVHYYLVIRASFSCKKLVDDVLTVLDILKFNFNVQRDVELFSRGKKYKRDEIFISGKKNLKRWKELIGFSNTIHSTKFDIWDKFKFCPPKTTLEQRIKILEGSIDPLDLEPQ